MSGNFTDKDNGFAALAKTLADMKPLVLTVGVHDTEGSAAHEGDGGSSGLTVAQVATIHEYGLGHNPERSFIRAWFDERRSENEANLRKIALAVLKGSYDPRAGLDRLGLLFVGQIQQRISGGVPPPLKAATIKRKGSSVPLINKGQLRSAIRHLVKVLK